ncbi:MAG TPA: type VI secretion protein IcmF/TssM N-terminal domain-containing protein, partial [Longimicrobiaceae bacterium]
MSGLGDLLLRLRPWLPAVLLAAAAGTALLAFLLWRAARRPQPAAPGGAAEAGGGETPVGADPVATSADLRRSFAEALSTLRRYVPGREFRYRIPWVLVVGESGSGQTTALAGSGAERPFADPGEDPLAGKQACRWSFFNRGVVLDVVGDLFLRAGGNGSDEWGWRTLLRLLRRHRPERPIDGVVLTVPCSTLYGRGALTRESLASRGEAAFHKLWEAQKQLGLRFPVYVLVTQCDQVAGFRALCSALPAPLLDDAFGWSSPYPLESSFSPAWVDEAFASMDRELYEAQVELLGGAEPAPDPDGVFRFPGELARLRDPLRTYLHEVFRESAYNESFFFRGVYFTGDADAALPALAPAVEGDVEEGVPAAAVRSRRPVFLRRLLEDKVLAERGLVRPAATAALSRNRVVRAAQVALVLFPLAAVLAGWHSHRRIQRNSTQLVTTLREVETDLRRLHGERHDTTETDAQEVWGDVRAYELLQKMSDVGQRALWSFLLPSSWFSDLRSGVGESMTTAFNQVIFP